MNNSVELQLLKRLEETRTRIKDLEEALAAVAEKRSARIVNLEDKFKVALQILQYWMKRSASGQWEKTDVARAMTKIFLDELNGEES